MALLPRLAALAIGLSAACVASGASAQERLHLETLGDDTLHRHTLPVEGDPVLWNLEGAAGVEGDVAEGAAPSPAWPFSLAEDVGFGLRHGDTHPLPTR